MYRARSFHLLRNFLSHKNVKQLCRASSAKANQEEQSNIIESNQSGEVKTTTPYGKLPARAPLAKNFFIGKVDNELLAYPEPLSREEVAKLKNDVLPLQRFFEEELDINGINANHVIAPQTLEQVKELGLFATTISTDYDGKGWAWTQSLFASEIESSCTDIAMQLTSHRVVVDLLQKRCTPLQQQRYLPKLSNGSMVATEAIFEFDAPDDEFFNTTASYDSSSRNWTLNGSKAFAITGPILPGTSTLFVVIAQTQRPNLKSDVGRSTTVFLVDSNMLGVKLGDRHLTFGCRGIEMRNVHFENVILSDDNIVDEAHNGNFVADTLLQASRLRNSVLDLAISKNILNGLTANCRDSSHTSMELNKSDIRKMHFSKGLCSVYAMESMIYLTAGLLDEFIDQDVAVECALTKYYSATRSFKLAKKYLDVVGPKSLHARESTELLFRNTAQLYTQGESIDTLQLQIALMGLQYAGGFMNETVRKSRNPLFNPTHILGRYLQSSSIDTPKTKMNLAEHLHPSLEAAAQCIEHSVARLQMCVELLFTRYGAGVIEEHSEMVRVSEIAATVYSMFASAGRASRSYCIGLPLADHELLTATAICSHGRDVVLTLSKDLFNGHYENNDNNLQRLTGQVLKSGYFPSHPLTFNY